MKRWTVLIFFATITRITFSQIQDTVLLEDAVVTGSPVKVSRNNVPMAVSIVTRQQIEESNESSILPILNGRVPGLFVTERGITGFGVAQNAAGQINIRGIGGSPTTGVLMLIDGHPQFMGLFGHPLADSYVASDVERVEVIRGSASILYGSNAMGGVINIITRKQSLEGFHGNGRVMYGSHNTQKYMLSGGMKKNKLSLFASMNHDQTNGHRLNSAFSIYNGYIKIAYELNDHIRATTDFSIAQFKATDPGPDTLNAKPGNKLDITRGYWAFTLDNKHDRTSGSTKLFYNFGTHSLSDGFYSNDKNYGLNIFQSIRLFEGSDITLGADHMNYGGKAMNETAMNGKGILFKDTTLMETGVYGFIQLTFFKKLTLNGGLRLQKHQIWGARLIPSGGFAWKIYKETTWKMNVSNGYRNPTIQELYFWNHNSNLKPERMMCYETGISRSFNKINLEVTTFLVNGKNMIVNVPFQGLINSGEIMNKGIEIAADAHFFKKLTMNSTYTFIAMKSPVYATPRHHYFISGRYTMNKMFFYTSIQYIDHLDTDPSREVMFQSYLLLNIKVAYKILKYADVFVSGENLLNKKYEINKYYPMPGITAFAGINIKY